VSRVTGGDRAIASRVVGRFVLATAAAVAFLFCSAPAGAYVYWSNYTDTIGRANPDGAGIDQAFVTGPAAGRGSGADLAQSLSAALEQRPQNDDDHGDRRADRQRPQQEAERLALGPEGVQHRPRPVR
jgi:hypothetical protein